MMPSRKSDQVRVLYVDDEASLRNVAVRALRRTEFTIVEASCGAEALALFATSTPDLVVLDVRMPGMSGFDVCSRIRAMPMGASLPILVLTALEESESIARAFEAGATDFLAKPFNYQLFIQRLRFMRRAAGAVDEAQQNAARLARAQRLAKVAQWELDLETGRFRCSDSDERQRTVSEHPVSDGRARFLDAVHPDDRRSVARALEDGKPHSLEYRVLLPDGAIRVVHQDAEIVVDPSGRTLLEGSAQDITELRAAERQAYDLAHYDPVTGLPNRTCATNFVAEAIAHAGKTDGQVAVLALDLDGFHRVNDTVGQSGGDELLRRLANTIGTCIRPSDRVAAAENDLVEGGAGSHENALTARLTGNELVVVLRSVRSPEDAKEVALRIAEKLAGGHRIGDADVFLSARVGIATFPANGTTPEELLDRAEAALRHAQQTGGNRCQIYTPEIQRDARTRLDIESCLRVSLARANIAPCVASAAPTSSDFELVYQPKVEVPSGRVVGVEALLRWQSPERGPISPMTFIPIAEETGLIVPLGAWVLETACKQARDWSLVGAAPLRVAVNVSVRQFREPGFVAVVARVLAETGVDPSLIELEITEGMIMENTKRSMQVLQELKGLGVRIALDDFGTGYSSLSYLLRLPIDSLKIDRSFINALGEEARGATVIAAIIGLSRGLGFDVVVEGVETAAQLAFVETQGVAEIQGYFFARPMPPAALDTWRERFESRDAAGLGSWSAERRAA